MSPVYGEWSCATKSGAHWEAVRFIDGGDGIGMGHRLDGSVLIPLLLILRQQIDLTS